MTSKLIFGLLFLTLVSAAPDADKVTSLPGTNFTVGFDHYSGYLNASDTKFFHYWFTKAQTDPDSSPVILWLNGGPVGYSYDSTGNVATSDDDVAQHNYNALVYFFTYKFPEYKNHDFYITGESYGGVYVPTLAVKVAADKTNFPHFKGVAIGNGIYSFPLNYNTLVPLYYYHGLVRQNLYDQAVQKCCSGNSYKCDYYSQLTGFGECNDLVDQLLNQGPDLDPYNLYHACYLDGGSRSKRDFIHRTLREKSKVKFQTKPKPRAGDLPLCAQENNTEVYLNRADVRKALHIPDNLPHWTDCSNKFVNGLGQTVISGTDSQEWFYHGETPNVGGFVTKFSGNLDFVTVRGSGHFVPEDRPREALQLIYNFIHQRDYSLPTPF
ncbi:hypothetical protein FO519_007623 [Halicephalobus sp. NKZ332]|nr:hypothetical protein FO519_007623 [Halicephalobus sp. NKZ332]